MGRTRTIDDNTLIKLIKQYFDEVCKGNARMLKLPKIAEYIASHGYPAYKVTSLRRSSAARKYIDSLMKAQCSVQDVVVFKPLDIEDFLDTNRTRKAQMIALSNLDNYYHTVADTSNAMIQNYKSLEKKCDGLFEKLEKAESVVTNCKDELGQKSAEVKALRERCDFLKELVLDYVYPEIANELLRRDGDLIMEKTSINTEHLAKELIVSPSYIEEVPEFSSGSNVIRGLFQELEE